MELPTSDHARLLDTDAHCIKFISTYSLETCNDKLETVMIEMALGRLNANLQRIRSCINIATHLRYRIICLTNDVSDESQMFKSEYEQNFSHYLERLNTTTSPISHASSKKPHLLAIEPQDHDSSRQLPSDTTSVEVGDKKKKVTRRGKGAAQRRNERFIQQKQQQQQCQMDIDTLSENPSCILPDVTLCVTTSLEDTASSIIERQTKDIPQCGFDVDFPDDKNCPCVSLRAPHVFHVSCIDLISLLKPFEPFIYRGFYGEKIEVQDPLKQIGTERSQPDDISVDDLLSICSTRRPAQSSLSTMDFVDWRELLSWASMYLH